MIILNGKEIFMYNLLIISSKEGNSYKSLYEQIQYLEKFNIKVILLIDPSELEFIKTIEENSFDCAYVHVKKRIQNSKYSYDPTRLLEYYKVPFVGNGSLTQMLISDKQLVSYKSGIGLPNIVITRNMWKEMIYPKKLNNIEYPIIVKPNSFHASQGISNESIVYNFKELEIQVGKLFIKYKNLNEILLEKYLENATEYTVSVLGNNNSFACSVAKFKYKESKNNLYSEKDKLSELKDRSFEFVEEENEQIRQRLISLSKSLFIHFNMNNFGRFDFIVGESVFLMEANSCPVPGNSFTWEWQLNYGLKKYQTIALFLCAFHFSQIASYRNDNLPLSLIMDMPKEIINKISYPNPVNVCPECTELTLNCKYPQLYKMNSRVGSEIEVLEFLKAITILIKPKLILETGTYNGNGTIAFAEGLKKNGFGKVISIEYDKELALIAKNNLSQYPVEIINCNSLSYTPTGNIDLLFLDSKRSIRKDEFLRFKPFLHESSIIIWHDSSYRERNHDVFDAVEEFYNSGIIDRILFPTPRGITISKLRVNDND